MTLATFAIGPYEFVVAFTAIVATYFIDQFLSTLISYQLMGSKSLCRLAGQYPDRPS